MWFLFQYSWYFFEALVKSMAQHLIQSGKVKVSKNSFFSYFLFLLSLCFNSLCFLWLVMSGFFLSCVCVCCSFPFCNYDSVSSQLSRNQRFTASFHHAVETLVNMLMPHITQKYKDNLDAARNANHSLAVFIKVRPFQDYFTGLQDWTWCSEDIEIKELLKDTFSQVIAKALRRASWILPSLACNVVSLRN